MREDMSKVVIERPRWGHSLPSKKTGQRLRRYDPGHEYEDSPKRLSGRAKYPKGATKEFSDFLTPLERFLQSSLGKPWDKVYSELCQHLDKRKTTGRHVFQHLELYVSTNCFYDEDGELWIDYYCGQPKPVSELHSNKMAFYVDPRSRLLCQVDLQDKGMSRRKHEARKRQQRCTLERKPINPEQSYLRINGEWFLGDYVLEDAPKDGVWQSLIELGLGYFDERKRWMRLVSKRKLNQQERQRVGLHNANPTRCRIPKP